MSLKIFEIDRSLESCQGEATLGGLMDCFFFGCLKSNGWYKKPLNKHHTLHLFLDFLVNLWVFGKARFGTGSMAWAWGSDFRCDESHGWIWGTTFLWPTRLQMVARGAGEEWRWNWEICRGIQDLWLEPWRWKRQEWISRDGAGIYIRVQVLWVGVVFKHQEVFSKQDIWQQRQSFVNVFAHQVATFTENGFPMRSRRFPGSPAMRFSSSRPGAGVLDRSLQRLAEHHTVDIGRFWTMGTLRQRQGPPHVDG